MNNVPTKLQISAGGVVFRKVGDRVSIALISVGRDSRWQLPKGLIGEGEPVEAAALREVREETGLVAEPGELIDKIEYWYFSKDRGARVRFHKFVYFYLLRYLSGEVSDHDSEVNEARWVEIDDAIAMLAFEGEKKVAEKARRMIEER
ncbi:MAG TPA: NUDIX domain-containing protein [Blastocatellia bacterium]|jgi:8-oxo-dGTP pyrophosphatase MutT (NUDIX family)|nr:NUDIX domain-containing protein [Blastocatellia bacterium]